MVKKDTYKGSYEKFKKESQKAGFWSVLKNAFDNVDKDLLNYVFGMNNTKYSSAFARLSRFNQGINRYGTQKEKNLWNDLYSDAKSARNKAVRAEKIIEERIDEELPSDSDFDEIIRKMEESKIKSKVYVSTREFEKFNVRKTDIQIDISEIDVSSLQEINWSDFKKYMLGNLESLLMKANYREGVAKRRVVFEVQSSRLDSGGFSTKYVESSLEEFLEYLREQFEDCLRDLDGYHSSSDIVYGITISIMERD